MLNGQLIMTNSQIWLKHFFYILTGLLLFQSTYALEFCGKKPQIPQKTATTFILAMGANTGELKKANADAQALANALQKRFNVPTSNTCVLTNVRRNNFNNALKDLQTLAQKQDKVFIYFSGHGEKVKDWSDDEDGDGNDGLINCYDEVLVIFDDRGRENSNIKDDSFVPLVNNIADKGAIVTTIIDSCFSGGMLRGTKNCLDMKSKLYNKTVDTAPKKDCPPSDVKKLKGTVYMASKENQLAWEYPTKGGIFTTSLIDNMRKYPYAELNEIFDITAEQVSRETGQRGCEQLQEPQRQP